MPALHPQLPSPEDIATWIRDQRYSLDLSQTELAKKAGISPSQLSRIENQSGRATYQMIYEIQETLGELRESSTTPVAEFLKTKHELQSDDYRFAYIVPGDSVSTAGAIMHELDISQLPVLSDAGENIGRITDQDLLSASLSPDDRVEEHMRRPFPSIPGDAPQSTVKTQLRTNEAILVTPGDTDLPVVESTSFAGILAPADFTETLKRGENL